MIYSLTSQSSPFPVSILCWTKHLFSPFHISLALQLWMLRTPNLLRQYSLKTTFLCTRQLSQVLWHNLLPWKMNRNKLLSWVHLLSHRFSIHATRDLWDNFQPFPPEKYVYILFFFFFSIYIFILINVYWKSIRSLQKSLFFEQGVFHIHKTLISFVYHFSGKYF